MAKPTVPGTPITIDQAATLLFAPTTTSAILANRLVSLKFRLLLHDLRYLAEDEPAQRRLSLATDPLYISHPYFTPSEAVVIKRAIVDTWISTTHHRERPFGVASGAGAQLSVQDILERCITAFVEKRRSIGDATPCGPTDLVPLYEAVFGIGRSKEEEWYLMKMREFGFTPCGDQERSKGKKRPAGDSENGENKKMRTN